VTPPAFRVVATPLDGSPFAEEALPLALQISRRSGGRLELLRAVLAPDAELRQAALKYLESLRDQLSQGAEGSVNVSLLDGETVQVLAERIREIGGDLAVLTTHARGPVGHLCLGSVANGLVRLLEVPTLLVPPRAPGILSLRCIAVPLDRSADAESILPLAERLARLFGSSLLLYHNQPPWTPLAAPTGTSAPLASQAADKAARREARAYLERIAVQLGARGITASTLVDAAPVTALGILELRATDDVGMIALTGRRQPSAEQLFAGSLVDKIIRGSPVPLLIAPVR
jgi:nucleotide-binding universal stress UspA family protein